MKTKKYNCSAFVSAVRPRFLTRPTQLRIGVGQTATLECQVQAEPGYRLFWQKMIGAHVEQLIFPKQPIDGRLLVSEDGMLTISNVQKKDQAIYVCTVISGPETISASARLTVVCKLCLFILQLSYCFKR